LGRKVDFKNTVLIMTSNIGAREINKSGGSFGFSKANAQSDYTHMRERLIEQVKKLFNPEFINRVDDIVVFRQLDRDDMIKIIDIVIAEMLSKVSDRNIKIDLSRGAKEYLADAGFDPQYGARPLRRTIQKFVENPIAEELLKGRFGDGTLIRVRKKGSSLELVSGGEAPGDSDEDSIKPQSIENE